MSVKPRQLQEPAPDSVVHLEPAHAELLSQMSTVQAEDAELDAQVVVWLTTVSPRVYEKQFPLWPTFSPRYPAATQVAPE